MTDPENCWEVIAKLKGVQPVKLFFEDRPTALAEYHKVVSRMLKYAPFDLWTVELVSPDDRPGAQFTRVPAASDVTGTYRV